MTAEDVLRPVAEKKRVLILGDGLVDVYSHGKLGACQDGCPKFTEFHREVVVGGAANARRSITRGPCVATWPGSTEYMGIKRRFLEDGKVVFRMDVEGQPSDESVVASRKLALRTLAESKPWHGVYLADYAKGYFTDEFIRSILQICRDSEIPVVADPKRHWHAFGDAFIKCNGEYALGNGVLDHSPGLVITHGGELPSVFGEGGTLDNSDWNNLPVRCVNHVGAGDCFGAWLSLGLAHGLLLQEAARLAHAAARVYVQHQHNRPPWPHEVRRELDPVGGKVIYWSELEAVRESSEGSRLVFSPGVFRLPHAGHSWTLDWARSRGDLLVVGVNSDVSAFRVKEGAFCLPLAERLQLIACQAAVDYAVVFDQDTPVELIGLLNPDLMVKGADSMNRPVPGSDLVPVEFSPPSPFRGHVTDLVKAVRG